MIKRKVENITQRLCYLICCSYNKSCWQIVIPSCLSDIKTMNQISNFKLVCWGKEKGILTVKMKKINIRLIWGCNFARKIWANICEILIKMITISFGVAPAVSLSMRGGYPCLLPEFQKYP